MNPFLHLFNIAMVVFIWNSEFEKIPIQSVQNTQIIESYSKDITAKYKHKKKRRRKSSKNKYRQHVYYSGVSIQCSGRTKSGARCSRMTKNTNGRCYQH